MEKRHLAQVNIGRLVAPLGDPRVAGFEERLAEVNALAERSEGFVWRLKSASGNATDVAWSDDPCIIVNMSVWESVAALRAFTYAGEHLEIFRQRREWFEKMDRAHGCLWWVPAGHEPTVAEAHDRLAHYQANGASEFAFWFSREY